MQPSASSSFDHGTTATPFTAVAALAVVAGGLIAAAVAHDPTEHTVWMVAYLVLVVGVAQFALGAGQSVLAMDKPSAGLVATECVVLNIGNAAVIAGTLSGRFPAVAVGGLLLIVALALFLYAVRKAHSHYLLYAYRALLIFVGLSAIIGLTLAAIGAHR